MKLRMALLKLFIAPIILALSFGLVGCSGKGSGSQTKVQLRVFQSDGSVSGGLNSAIIDQTANPNVAVYIQVTAPDISPPLEYYFSPAEVSANAGIVTMMVPSGSGRTFILQVLSFGTGETTDTFPGVNYKSSQSADQLTFDLTGAPVVVNVAMEPASTADLEGKIYDGRTGDIMPLNVPCAQPDVHAAFSLGPYSGVSLPVQVTVNSGGDYVIHNVPTDVPITLSALDKTTGASSSISFQFSPSTITKQNIVLDGAKPLVISPTSANVLTNEMVEFTVDGGIPPYSILLTQNNSNGSINQSTPVSADYTSGNIGGEGDVITAIDAVSRGGEGCYNDYIGSDWYAIVVVEYHPLSISPANPTIHASSTIQFVGSGGDGIYSWAIIGSETPGTCQGSTIDSGGLYTPDLNGNCTDTIQLSDYSGDTPVTTTVNVLLGNMAPTITNLPQTVNVRWGKNGSYTVTGNDNLNSPPNNLTWSLGANTCSFTPTINSASGVVNWTCGGVETCTVDVVLTDDGIPPRSDTDTLTINCTDRAPTITSTAPASATEGVLYSYSIICTDPDGDSRSLWLGPADTCGGAVADNHNGTGSYTFTPNEGQGGTACTVGVVCSDTQMTYEAASNVTVAETNQNPSVAVTCPTNTPEDTPTTCSVTASDPDIPNTSPSDPGYLTCSINASTTCAGATMTSCTQVDVPAQGEAAGPGSCNVVVDVVDGWSASAQGNAVITIDEVNQNPSMAVNCPTSVPENATMTCSLTASDPDFPNTLTTDPGHITCSINALTTCTGATITGCTQVSVPAQGEAAGPGSCNVVVDIVDGYSATSQGSATVAIDEVNQNPAGTVNCPTNVPEDAPSVCTLTASDPDLPSTSPGDPGYVTCSIDALTTCVGATVTGCTQVDVPAQGELAGPGSCNVVVDILDGLSATSQSSAVLTIAEVNQNPSVSVSCPTNVFENAPMTCSLTASDPDFPNTLTTDPGYIACSINALTTCTGATITGCTQVDVPAQGEMSPLSCTVVVDVQDGYLATTQGIATVTVDEINQNPSVAVNCPTEVLENSPMVCALAATDSDWPNTLPTDPGYLTCSLNASTSCAGATITGCTQVDVPAQGEMSPPWCTVVVDIQDGWLATGQGSVVVAVSELNQQPSVTVNCPTNAPEDTPTVCSVTASDPDFPNTLPTDPGYITCSLSAFTTCVGATITGCTQVNLPAQGEASGPGSCNVVVDVVDGYLASAQGIASVTIAEVNQNPSVAVTCPTSVAEDTPTVCSLTASDPDLPNTSPGDPGYITCSINASTTCTGATITGCTQVDVPAQGEASGPGSCNVVVDVTDGYTATAQSSASVTITEVNQNPSVAVNCPTSVAENAPMVCPLAASDPDLPNTLPTDPGYITCSLNASTTCTGATITGCTQVNVPAQGEAAGPGSCKVVVDVMDGYSATGQGSATVSITEVNQNPTMSVSCPTNVAEDTPMMCTLTASDSDLPNTLPTDPGYIASCSLSASTTCTGATITGCTQVNVPAQGEAAGPGSCNVVVNVLDGYAAAGQGSATVTITEVNQNPSVSVFCPANVAEDAATICTLTASDPDLPNASPGDPGYITCSLNGYTTCTGATIVGCTKVNVPAQGEAAGPGMCSVFVDITDGYSTTSMGSSYMNITEVNQNPSISINCPTSVGEDAPMMCSLTASDPDLPNTYPTDPGYITCSLDATTTCTGATITGCTQVDVPAQGETAGPGSCNVVVDIMDGWSATSQASGSIDINEVNRNPNLILTCPGGIQDEDKPVHCTIAASDPDIPAQTLTCSLDASTTCTGVVVTDCVTDFDIPPQGEAAGPGVCIVQVDATDTKGAKGFDSYTLAIGEVNVNPYWTVTPETKISLISNEAYAVTDGVAMDDDLPNTTTGDPGYLTCAILNNTCSFAITTTNTGAGSVSCDISFTSGPTTESCTFDEVANDGYGGSASQIVSVNVTGVWYVDAGASGANSGTSWADAFTKIQSAMSAALSGDMVWVRQGTFQATLATDEAVITIPNGVRVYGGFMGVETSLADRSIPSLSATTVLDGQNSNCHVVIGNSNTVLDGFTVRNGRAITSLYCTNPWGGGICNSYAYNTYLKNLWVAYNYAQGVGGGIFNKNSFTTVGNSNISHNTSLAQGGGVYNYHSNMYVSYSTISNNYSSMSWGGAFSNSYTTFEMAISTLEYNHAWVSGGAIANSRTDTWISTSEFRYNSSSNPVSNAYGGAISNYGSYGTIEFSLFYENQATSNNAVSFGGAISNASDSPVYISHNTFSYNSAKRGGAISNNYYSAPLISNNIFYENYAQNGGGAIANLGASTPEIRLSQFYWNHTSSKGGAIYSNNSSPVISDNIFNYNNASYSGGAIYTNGYAPSYYAPYAKINNCQFNYNYANYVGGAMYNRNSDAHVDHSSFKNNHCTNSNCYGGAIALYNDSGSVANSTLEYNLATLGGAIAVYTGSPVISNDIIANNHANRNGGGVFTSHNPNIYIENSIILGNSANNGGGGIFNYTTTGGLDCPHVNNTVIANNTAQYGAGLYNYDTQVFVTNSTITGNISTYGDGAGIYVYDRLSTYSVTVKNSIVWGNTSSSGYYNPDIHIPASSPIILNTIVRNSDIGKYVYDSYYHMGYMEPYPGVANIYNDPLFISTPEFNFHLQSDSPCRNAGSPLASMRDPNGSRNDMGAFGGPGTTHFDRDYDGMEDWWEILYGLNPYSALDASQDPDGDGYTNLQEFNNHTNPKVWNP